MKNKMQTEYDLAVLAENGLRRGRTTGSCAAAAAKAALIKLLTNETMSNVQVTLPNRQEYLKIPVAAAQRLGQDSASAQVTKYAGDDPDCTDGALITATIARSSLPGMRLYAGAGVGTVSKPGLRISVGRPAINPVPEKMILDALNDVLLDLDLQPSYLPGLEITISCLDGEIIAKKTFNQKLGIIGGISILGTTGIVEPLSLAAYEASVELYVRSACAARPESLAFLPGNIGLSYCRQNLQLPADQMVHISNFLGAAISALTTYCHETNFAIKNLHIVGHPGKLAKVLNGSFNLHSSKSEMAMSVIAAEASSMGICRDLCARLAQANTVEHSIEIMAESRLAAEFWQHVENEIAEQLQTHAALQPLSKIDFIKVKLLAMNSRLLGEP